MTDFDLDDPDGLGEIGLGSEDTEYLAEELGFDVGENFDTNHMDSVDNSNLNDAVFSEQPDTHIANFIHISQHSSEPPPNTPGIGESSILSSTLKFSFLAAIGLPLPLILLIVFFF